MSAARRFRVALSFPGEHRGRVEKIALGLAVRLGRERVLYDRWYGAEFARFNLDLYLPTLYHDQSDLVVCFLCGEYNQKEWCGLEWRAVRDLLKGKQDERLMMAQRTILADALHQSGDFTEALHLFADAEQRQAKYEPAYPILYSVRGYRYCDFLLGQGQTAEVVRRASQTLHWAEKEKDLSLLANGLDHLSLGRAHAPRSDEATDHLNQAVDFLRRAGALHHLPRGLLARGKPSDLNEVFRIATRSGMRLHLTDYHLASARLALSNSDREQARTHVEKAEGLVNETGYHRRDQEVAELRAKVDA